MSEPLVNGRPKGQAPKEHLSYLDSLRGFSALGVVLVHATLLTNQMTEQIGLAFDIGTAGQRGVQFFYIISAFTLCHSFAVRHDWERHPLGNYFIRRFFRIAPLFYVAIIARLLYGSVAATGAVPPQPTYFQIFLGVVFLNGFDPNSINNIALGGWSIAVETTFYAVLPLLLSFVRNFRQALLLLVAAVPTATLISNQADQYFHNPDLSGYFHFAWFPIEFPIFCMGIAGYFAWKEFLRHRDFDARRILLSLFFLLNAVALFVACIPIGNTTLNLTSLALLLLLLGISLRAWRLIVNPVTVFLGRISYSIYLGHFYCIPFVFYFCRVVPLFKSIVFSSSFAGLALTFFMTLAFAVPLASLTYFLIEKPGILLGKIWIESREKRPVAERI